jgi:hypothetical protein
MRAKGSTRRSMSGKRVNRRSPDRMRDKETHKARGGALQQVLQARRSGRGSLDRGGGSSSEGCKSVLSSQRDRGGEIVPLGVVEVGHDLFSRFRQFGALRSQSPEERGITDLGILVLGSLKKHEGDLLRRRSDDELPLNEYPLGLQFLEVGTLVRQSSIVAHDEHGSLVMVVVEPLVVEERGEGENLDGGEVGSALESSASETTRGDDVGIGAGVDGSVRLTCDCG